MRLKFWLPLFLSAALAPCVLAGNPVWNWSNPQPHGNDIVDMVWNGTLGVQVCELGRVYTSPNLIDWYAQASGLTNDLQAVTFLGQRIIVTGANGAIAYSDDGVNFTNASVNTTNWLVAVAASPTLAVAVGDDGVIYTSPNGAAWTLRNNQPPNVAPCWLTSVAYGNGTFVTVSDNGGITGNSYIANSSDGIHWTNQTPSASFMNGLGNLESVVWVNPTGSSTNFPYTGFWAVDDAGHVIYSTNNGVNWKKIGLLASTNCLYAIAADNASVLLAGDSEVRLGSAVSGVVTWPEQTGNLLTAVPPWTYFTALTDTNGVFALAGSDGQLVESYSTNGGYAWTTPYETARDWLWQVTVTNGLYVAVGDNARIMTSDNGADWTVEAIDLTNSISLTNTVFFCVGGTSNLLVAAGTSGSLAISPNQPFAVQETNTDGSLLTNSVGALGVYWLPLVAPTTNDLAGVGCFAGKFFLVGGNGTLLTSLDGTNWAALNSGTTNYLSGIAAATNGLLVTAGNLGTLLTSTNGTNWISRSSGTTNWLYRLRNVNGWLLAMGENGTLLTSLNGTNWTKAVTGVTNWLNDAIAISNTCYVVGNQGTVLTSTNYTNWTSIGTLTTKSLYGLATQNGQLIAVGFEGTILRSQIIPDTTPVNITEYDQSAGYNLFSVAGAVDQQFTLDSSTNLVNWSTGPLLNLIYGDGTLIFYQNVPTPPAAKQFYRCTVVP